MSEILTEAVFDPAVIATVQESVVIERYETAIDDPERDPFVSNARIVRDPEPADYVAAVHEHIDKFDGLDVSDVDEQTVTAVLSLEETA